MLKAEFPRPRATNYQAQDPTIVERLGLEERYRQAVKLSIDEALVHRISAEMKKRLDSTLYDMGQDYFYYNEKTRELKFLRFVGEHLKSRLLSGLDDNLEFSNYIEKINAICKELFEKQIKATEKRMEAGKAYEKLFDEELKKFKQLFNEKHQEAEQLAARKSRPARVYSEEEKNKNLHWQNYAESDLVRSKDNLISKKLSIKKEIRRLNSEVNVIDDEIKPFTAKIDECDTKLETDLDEKTYKDIRLSKEFSEAQIDRLRRKMLPFFEEVYECNQQVEKIDEQLTMLDILIDREALLRDALTNFPRRKERLLHRVNKLLKEQTEIETLRTNLNARWRELTGDPEPLCAPLGLKINSEMYFI